MRLDDLYRDVILDHHKAPRGRAPLSHVDASAEGKNPTCGDEVTVNVQFEGETVQKVQISGLGCAISTAAGSMLSEIASGKTVSQIEHLSERIRQMLRTGEEPENMDMGDLEALAGVSRFPVRVKCAMLPVVTLLEAIATFQNGKKKEKGT